MDLTGDDLAGIVDLFGALTHDELVAALSELAFRRGEDPGDDALAGTVDDAVDDFYLVRVDDALVPGPAAFPELPDGAEDLPHILDADRRTVDRQAAATAAEQQFRRVASTAVEHGDPDRLQTLLDVSYDLEAWGPVDVSDARDAIDRTLDE